MQISHAKGSNILHKLWSLQIVFSVKFKFHNGKCGFGKDNGKYSCQHEIAKENGTLKTAEETW